MSGAEPSMSGAKDSVVADESPSSAGAETTETANTGKTETADAAESAGATETAETAETAEAAGSASSALAATTLSTATVSSKDKQKAPEDAAGPSSQATMTVTAALPPSTAAADAADTVSVLPQVPPPAAVRNRADSSTGLGDDHAAAAASIEADGVVCNITLLLPTGARHPYRIDDKYLAKRNVDVPGVTDAGKKDPFTISVYKLKELILREWRDDWEGRPSSPSSIRLIHFGKLLEDKEQLKKYHFSAEAPNVVHMSVKPAELLEEDEASKGKNASRDPHSREGGSGCCVIL